MKQGINHAGALVSGEVYARQRIEDALSTPKGTIYFCRGYGSKLHELIDENQDDAFYMSVCHEVARVFDEPINGLDDCEFMNVKFNKSTMTVYVTYNNKELIYDIPIR